MQKTIRLKVTPVKLVTKESDLDVEVEERTLQVPAVIFRNAVRLAETLNRQFRAQSAHFFQSQSKVFALTLSNWLANQQEMATWPPTRGFSPIKQLGDYFEIPGNRRWLERLVAFVAASNGFTIED